jgi:hypothetical protein
VDLGIAGALAARGLGLAVAGTTRHAVVTVVRLR